MTNLLPRADALGLETGPVLLDDGTTLAAGRAADFAWTNIQSEQFRIYRFNGGLTVKITDPQYLAVSGSGGHRVLDGAGASHYIPAGWQHLFWHVREGDPHFVA